MKHNGAYTVQDKKAQKKTARAAIYARVSSSNQVNGYSLDEQIRICRDACKRMNWRVKYVFRENCSGANIERAEFQKMLEKAWNGEFDVLVFWKLDRFARSLTDVVNVERELSECRVSLYGVTDNIDTATPAGRFVFRTLASAAELERELIRERSKMGMRGLALQHKWPNRLPPLGYRKRADGYLEVGEEEAALVRRIFAMYLELKSMPQTAFKLNQEGIKTKKGLQWTATAVKRVLDDEIYIGKYRVAGVEEFVKEYKILDARIFRRAKELRSRAKKVREAMPKSRKEEMIDRIFGDYMRSLSEEENNPHIEQPVSPSSPKNRTGISGLKYGERL